MNTRGTWITDRIALVSALVGVALMGLALATRVNPADGSVVRPEFLQTLEGRPFAMALLVACVPGWAGTLLMAHLGAAFRSPTAVHVELLFFQTAAYWSAGALFSLALRTRRAREHPGGSHPRAQTAVNATGAPRLGSAHNRPFYLLVLPSMWAVCSLLHWQHPGDEYAMYFISSIAGSWIWLLIPVGDIHNPLIPSSVAAVGALGMAGMGWVLTRIRAPKAVWAALFVVSALGILFLSLTGYPSIDRALAKNGSWWAYICSSILLGMYLATGLSLAVTGMIRLWRTRCGSHRCGSRSNLRSGKRGGKQVR
jgi:hypothetical protein